MDVTLPQIYIFAIRLIFVYLLLAAQYESYLLPLPGRRLDVSEKRWPERLGTDREMEGANRHLLSILSSPSTSPPAPLPFSFLIFHWKLLEQAPLLYLF